MKDFICNLQMLKKNCKFNFKIIKSYEIYMCYYFLKHKEIFWIIKIS